MRPRRQDWPERLARYLSESEKKSFEWGVHDCALFVSGALQAMTDEDPAAPYRGSYRSARGALSILRALSGTEVLDSLPGRFLPSLPVSESAQRGDICAVRLTRSPEGEDGFDAALGVCIGAKVVIPAIPKGFRYLPLSSVIRAYRVE